MNGIDINVTLVKIRVVLEFSSNHFYEFYDVCEEELICATVKKMSLKMGFLGHLYKLCMVREEIH